jgi:hypothetical protein
VGYINTGKIPLKALGILAAYSLVCIILTAVVLNKRKVDIRY